MFKLNLRNKIFIFVSAITLGLIISTFLIVNYRLSGQTYEAINSNLQETRLAFDKLQRFRYDQLLKSSIIISESPKLKGLISTGDPSTVIYGISEFNEDLGADLFFVTDNKGIVLGRLNSPSSGEDLSGTPLIRDALAGYDSENTFWEAEGRLYQVVSIPAILQNEVLGTLTAGFEMDDGVASELKELTGSEISFVVGGRVVGSTLGSGERSDLERYLAESRAGSPQGNEGSAPSQVVLQRERYLALFASLGGGTGQVGTYMMLSSLDKALEPLRGIRRTLILVGVLGIVAGLVVSYFISNGITAPIKRLVKGSEEIGRGNYDYRIDLSSKDEIGYLGESFNKMAVNLRASQESLMRTIAELSSLNEVGKAINSTLDLRDILSFILRKALQFSGASSGFLALPVGGRVELSAELNIKSPEKAVLSRLIGEIYNRTAQRGAEIIDGREGSDSLSRSILRSPLRNLVALPLVSQGLSLGVMGLYNRRSGDGLASEDVELLSSLAYMAATAIQKDNLYKESLEKQAIERELSIAHDIQMRLLPAQSPRIKGYEISSRCVPARSVGGDLYDFIPLGEDHLGVIIGDVAGHGVAAALLMAITKSVLEIESRRPHAGGGAFSPPNEVAERTNDTLCREFSDPTMFVTLFYGVLDFKSKEFIYSNAGHNYPLVIRSSGETLDLGEGGGTVIGCFPGISYDLGRVSLRPGDILVLYTDGIVETRDISKTQFGTDKLKTLIFRHRAKPPSEVIDRLFEEVGNFAQNATRQDDMTVVLVKIT